MQEAELIVSIVVPSAAKKVATKVAKAALKSGRKDLLYCDANAISPMTADAIATVLAPAGVNFVDGCIIGSAARMGKGTIVYLSGPQAERLRGLEAFNIPLKALGSEHQSGFGFQSRLRRTDQGAAGIIL